jgi:hypothetical protein
MLNMRGIHVKSLKEKLLQLIGHVKLMGRTRKFSRASES